MMFRHRKIALAVTLVALAAGLLVVLMPPAVPRTVVAVLTAFPAEAAPLIAVLENAETQPTVQYPTITTGRLDGRDVLIVTTGAGMVNAAAGAQYVIDNFPVTHLIFSGVAGSLDPDIVPGMVVVPRIWVNHQLRSIQPDAEPPLRPDLAARAEMAVGSESGFPVDSALLSLLDRPGLENVRVGGVGASGDAFIASDAYATELRAVFDAVIVDMESAAVAQVALNNGIPFIAVRGISDSAGETAFSQIQANVVLAAGDAARLARAIIALLA